MWMDVDIIRAACLFSVKSQETCCSFLASLKNKNLKTYKIIKIVKFYNNFNSKVKNICMISNIVQLLKAKRVFQIDMCEAI